MSTSIDDKTDIIVDQKTAREVVLETQLKARGEKVRLQRRELRRMNKAILTHKRQMQIALTKAWMKEGELDIQKIHLDHQRWLTRAWFIAAIVLGFCLLLSMAVGEARAQDLHLTPDGTWVKGDSPELAPDGTWVAGDPQLTPKGTWIGSGEQELTPDGNWVAGDPHITPDGNWVGGTPVLAPDGEWK